MFKRPGLAFKVTMAAIFRTRPLWGCPRNPLWPPWWNHTWPKVLFKGSKNSVWKSEQELAYVYICSDPTKSLQDHPHFLGGIHIKAFPKINSTLLYLSLARFWTCMSADKPACALLTSQDHFCLFNNKGGPQKYRTPALISEEERPPD